MAGILIDEPLPRSPPGDWHPFLPRTGPLEPLEPPWNGKARNFELVANDRRTTLRGPVPIRAVGNLLWYLSRNSGSPEIGRAGLTVRRRAAPSSGGLHPIQFVCMGAEDRRALLYDGTTHGFLPLKAACERVLSMNEEAVLAVLGATQGVTIRYIADRDLVAAAYENPDSLLLRDAGALLATTCLFAEWLNLSACPLGFLGTELVGNLGFPAPRFVGVGGVQITA